MQNEEELVRRAQGGDRRAFGLLVTRHQETIARTVTAMLGPGQEVDDVVQDVFIRCYESLDRFRGTAAFGTYLHRIAINKSLDTLRRRKRWRARFIDDATTTFPDSGSSLEKDYEASDQSRLVLAAIAQLQPRYRAVVTLRLIEGLSTDETATALGIKYGTVLSRLSRGTSQLRLRLKGVMEDDID